MANQLDKPTKNDDGKPTTEKDNAASNSAAHDLPSEIVGKGGVTFADYDAADVVTIGQGTDAVTVNALAVAAAGKTTGDREIGDAERAQNALRIDAAVRSHASF